LGNGSSATYALTFNLSGASDPQIVAQNALLAVDQNFLTTAGLLLVTNTTAGSKLSSFATSFSDRGVSLLRGDGTIGTAQFHTAIMSLGAKTNVAANVQMLINPSGPRIIIPSGGAYSFSSGTGASASSFNTSGDTGTSRAAAGVLAIGTGAAASTAGWFRWGGESSLAADGSNATATMANTGLSVTVTTGRKYTFKMILYVNDSVAADGVKIDFDGGTATATNFRAHVTLFDSALNLSTQLTALATDASAAVVTGDSMVEVHGSFEPSSTGTFIPRYAQAAHTTGTLTIYRGSHITMFDTP
jgi:hypothetical protein